MKIALNRSFADFRLSVAAGEWLLHHDPDFPVSYHERSNSYVAPRKLGHTVEFRCNPLLIRCIETLGLEASHSNSHIRVFSIPHSDCDQYFITEHDGYEQVSLCLIEAG